MAFTAVGALIVGETAVTATLVLAAVAEVGMALTVVGAITGSKDLMKIGGVLGLVGGVGGMIAGGMSGAAAGAGAAEGAAGSAAEGVADTALNGSDLMSNAFTESGATGAGGFGGTAASTTGAMPELAASMPNPTDMRLAAGTQSTPGGLVSDAMGPTPAATVNDVSTPAGPQAPQGPQAPSSPADLNANPLDGRLQAGTATTPGNAPVSSGKFWSSFSDFADKNKTLLSGGMQLLGGAMNGANQRDMWNQKMQLDQQNLQRVSYGNQVGNFAPTGVINGART